MGSGQWVDPIQAIGADSWRGRDAGGTLGVEVRAVIYCLRKCTERSP